MKSDYREIQYFHPLFYVAAGGTAAVLLSITVVQAVSGVASAVSLAAAGTGLLLLLMLAALGRIVVTVDDHNLTLYFGWLHWIRRSFSLDDIDLARVCVLKPLTAYLGWGLRHAPDKPICYAPRYGRGVEITCQGRLYVIGSDSPAQLKAAVLKYQDLTDDQPEYRRENLAYRFPRRRLRTYQSWGLLHPHELRQ